MPDIVSLYTNCTFCLGVKSEHSMQAPPTAFTHRPIRALAEAKPPHVVGTQIVAANIDLVLKLVPPMRFSARA